MSRPYTYVGRHTAQNERCGIYGIFERQEQSNDILKVGEYEIRIPQLDYSQGNRQKKEKREDSFKEKIFCGGGGALL